MRLCEVQLPLVLSYQSIHKLDKLAGILQTQFDNFLRELVVFFINEVIGTKELMSSGESLQYEPIVVYLDIFLSPSEMKRLTSIPDWLIALSIGLTEIIELAEPHALSTIYYEDKREEHGH